MEKMGDIDVFEVLEYIKRTAPKYAQAKADRIYCEEFRKSKKALLMKDAELLGHNTVASQEREAYASPDYLEVIHGLKAAVALEEEYKFKLISAQAAIEVWRSLGANQRAEAKVL